MTKRVNGFILAACALSSGTPVAGQSAESGRAGLRPVLDQEMEVALALSAAPADVRPGKHYVPPRWLTRFVP